MGKCRICKAACDEGRECFKVGDRCVCENCLKDLRKLLGVDKLEKRVDILDREMVQETKEEADWR